VRKFGAVVGLLARLAIIFNWQQGNCLCYERQRPGKSVNKKLIRILNRTLLLSLSQLVCVQLGFRRHNDKTENHEG